MCEQDLAFAVLLQAEKDANKRRDCYTQRTARNFLCGVNSIWRDSLENWALLAGADPEWIMFKSRQKWRKDLLKGTLCKNK